MVSLSVHGTTNRINYFSNVLLFKDCRNGFFTNFKLSFDWIRNYQIIKYVITLQ